MTFFKKDFRPILQNLAASAIWAVLVLAGATVLPLVTPLRTVTIPLWLALPVFLFMLIWVARSKINSRRGRDENTTPALEIHSAHYGASYKHVDVTGTVQCLVHNGILDVLVTNDVLCGGMDPLHGFSKYLTLRYTLDGRQRTILLGEGSHLILP